MATKTIVLFCYISISVSLARDTWINTSNRDEQSRTPPPPPFARGASDEAVRELQQIYADPYQTKQELFDRVEAWAREQGDANLAEYYEYIEKAENHHRKLMEKLSDAKIEENLKRVIAHILEMGEDKSITFQDEARAMKRIQRRLTTEQLAKIGNFLLGVEE